MKQILTMLVETGDGIMAGKLGDCSVVLERMRFRSRGGQFVWRLSLAAKDRGARPKPPGEEHWKARQRKREGVESLGGND
jgi:hypothetical protein